MYLSESCAKQSSKAFKQTAFNLAVILFLRSSVTWDLPLKVVFTVQNQRKVTGTRSFSFGECPFSIMPGFTWKCFTVMAEWGGEVSGKRNQLPFLNNFSSICMYNSQCSLFSLQAQFIFGSPWLSRMERINIHLIIKFGPGRFFGSRWWFYSPTHDSMYCFRIILKCLILVYINSAIKKVWIWLMGLGEIFINCDPVLLLLICETVWNKLHTLHVSFKSLWKIWFE